MKIADQLKLNALISIAMLAAIGLACAVSFSIQRDALRRSLIADGLMQGAFELNVMSDYYLRHPGERVASDWLLKHADLVATLKEQMVEGRGEQIIAVRMTRNLEAMAAIFAELVASHGVNAPHYERPESSRISREEQLANMMLLRAREVSGDASRLSAQIHTSLRQANRNTGWFLALTVTLLTIIVASFAISVGRSLLRSVNRLRTGAEIIGAGNLDHRVGLPADDEIGQLSHAFDRMAEQLQATTVSIDVLRASEARLQTLFEQAPLGIYLVDSDFRLSEVNPVARPVFGDIPNLIGRDFAEVIYILWPPKRAEEIIHRFRHTLETGETYFVAEEVVERRNSDATEYYEWQVNRISLPDGRNGVVCHFRDISPQVRARQAVAESESRYHTLFNSIDEGFCVIDVLFDATGAAVDYRFVETNPAFDRHSGLPNAEGKTVRELVPDQDEHWFATYGDIALTGESRRFESFGKALGRWFDVYAFRVGRPEDRRVAVIFKDITLRKLTEAALRESEARYRTLFQSMEQAFVVKELIVDAHGRVDFRYIEANPAFEKQSGLNDVIGKTVLEAIPDIEPQWVEQYAAVARTGEPVRFQQQARGLGRWFDVFAWRIEGTDPPRVAILFSDITQQRRSVEALQQARHELEQRVAERTAELQARADQLARLTSELTMAEQRERRRLAQLLHDHLQQLLVAAKIRLGVVSRSTEPAVAAIAQVNTLLDDAIKASRSLTVELAPPVFHESDLAGALNWLARWMESKHGLRVTVRCADGAGTDREDVRVLVFGAVRELLFNIVKHAGVAEASIELAQHDPEHLCVIVSDKGRGFNVDAAEPGGAGDTVGFGLFSIRERLATLGGRLEIGSSPGAGSRFTLIAPAHPQSKAVPEAQPAQEVPPGATRPQRPAHRAADGQIRVLIADDHDVVRQGLATLLAGEPEMAVIGEASDGIRAVELARDLHPDVVLMDFSMPLMDGVDATRAIMRELPSVRIIGLSMYDDPERGQAMIDAGAAAYITKSGESHVLLKTIREVCAASTA